MLNIIERMKRVRIRELHVAGERGENQIADLHALRRDQITERQVICAEELREVVQQDQQDA